MALLSLDLLEEKDIYTTKEYIVLVNPIIICYRIECIYLEKEYFFWLYLLRLKGNSYLLKKSQLEK